MKTTLTSSEKISHEYCCTIVKIGEIKPIEGADKIVQTEVEGRTIIIGKDEVKEGDIMFYVSNECELNKDFLFVNNLFDDPTLNKDPEKKGYINKRGRVRMIKLRGVYSMGFLFTVEAMKNYFPAFNVEEENLSERIGEDFDTVDGTLFVKAYVPPMPESNVRLIGEQRRAKKLAFDRMIPGQFALHYDTKQLQREISRLNPDDVVCASTKVHGCVDAETLINTNLGQFTIKHIVYNKLDCLIEAYDTYTQQKVFVPIDQYYHISNDGDWYELELENGIKLTITGNNPVFLPDRNCYRKVWDLKPGDSVLFS